MAKRTKKPAVRLEVRRQWLRRFEEDGESPPQIAKAAGFDVRTVRKQIEIAREEREMREARATVLRQALEDHYADLCAFAKKLDAEISWPPRHISLLLKDDRMWRALKEHLPRSVIWKAFSKWEELVDRFDMCANESKKRAQVEAEKRGWNFHQHPLEHVKVGLLEGFVTSIVSHVVSVAFGGQGLKDVLTFSYEASTESGVLAVRIGNFGGGYVYSEQATELENTHHELLDEALAWEESEGLHQTVLKIKRQSEVLHDELALITLRRVVPGRCRYCPL